MMFAGQWVNLLGYIIAGLNHIRLRRFDHVLLRILYGDLLFIDKADFDAFG